MKILQLPTNIAGQPFNISEALKELGYDSNLLSTQNKFEYQTDLTIKNSKYFIVRQFRKISFFIKACMKYDVFHYHTDGFLFANIDVIILKLLKKKIFIQFHGSEIRLYDIEKKRNRFFISDNILNQKSKIRRLKFWSFITNTVIVSDHSLDAFLEPYFKNIYVIGQVTKLNDYKIIYPDINNKIPLIVHAPSVKSTKGTQHVTMAIEELKKIGLNFNYQEVHNVSHSNALKIYQKADIVIDQLLIGSYGIVTCECMAMGKPIICYILNENIVKYGKILPIVNANPDSITKVLKDLILNPEKRYYLGKKSRLYAEKIHNSEIVAKKLINIYNA